MTDWPRLLRREKAAAYLGRSPRVFDREVRSGLWPKARKVGNISAWDRAELDAWLDDGLNADHAPSLAQIAALAGLSRQR